MMESWWVLSLWVLTLNAAWHGPLGVGWCMLRRPMPLDACASIGELIVCDDMVGRRSYVRGLALVLI